MNAIAGLISKIQNKFFQGEHKKRQYFITYTILFAVMCLIIYCWYFFTGRTFIFKGDGWNQYYKAMVYYSEYMRDFFYNLFCNHQIVFKEMDFCIGEGSDILQAFNYYAIGDPFTLLSVLVPAKYMWIYYDFSILLKIYLSGVAFSCLCFYTNKNIGRYASLAGTISYVFCYWVISNTRHPFFLNPMIYFPLLILGIEKILNKEKPYVFIVSVFLATISNFYFFYNLAILTAAYMVVRLIVVYRKNIKAMFYSFLRIAGSAIIGVMMGGIILLPVLYDFLNDKRTDIGYSWHLLYPLKYYSSLFGEFFYTGSEDTYYLCLGFAAPVMLAILLLFMKKKKNFTLKLCFAICMVIILVPALGQFLNGMSYRSNKWCWAFALLCSYIFAVMWQELMTIKSKDALKLFVGLAVWFLLIFIMEYSRTIAAFACIGVAFVFLLVIYPLDMANKGKNQLQSVLRQPVCLVVVCISVIMVSFFKNSSSSGAENYASKGVEIDDAEDKLMLTEASAVASVAEDDGATGFYRYAGNQFFNSNVLTNIQSAQYYWSVSNPYISKYMESMELRNRLSQYYSGYDDRTALLTLSSVRYYAVPAESTDPIPYGYEYVDEFDINEALTENAKTDLAAELGTEASEEQLNAIEKQTSSVYSIYRNRYAMTLSYCYDNVISDETWDELSALDKQEAMLQGVHLEGYEGEANDSDIVYDNVSCDYDLKCNSEYVTLEDYGFVVTKAGATVTLSFDGLPCSETYFCIKGLEYDDATTYELYFGDDRYDPQNMYTETEYNLLSYTDRSRIKKDDYYSVGTNTAIIALKSDLEFSKNLVYKTSDYEYYNNMHDISVNMGYADEAVNSITLTFKEIGIYSFDNMEIICQPTEHYNEYLKELGSTKLQNVKINTDTVQGSITMDDSGVLCLSVPYSIGWTAYVDGEETEIYLANIKYMGIPLSEGKHSVKLVYHTPYLREGALLSLAGLMIFIILICVNKYLGRKRAKLKVESE